MVNRLPASGRPLAQACRIEEAGAFLADEREQTQRGPGFPACCAHRCCTCCACFAETEEDLSVEVMLPFWIDSGDVRVSVTETELKAVVRNTVSLRRTFWRNRLGRLSGGGGWETLC